MIPAFPVYLFDVDGTLVDSAPDICGAVSAVLETTSAGKCEMDFLRGYIGPIPLGFASYGPAGEEDQR